MGTHTLSNPRHASFTLCYDFSTVDVDIVGNMVVWDACRFPCWLTGDLGKILRLASFTLSLTLLPLMLTQ